MLGAASTAGLAAWLSCNVASAQNGYKTRVVVSGLTRPTGIAALGSKILFVTQLPTPGVSGPNGGSNTVDMINLGTGQRANLTTGEPEPTNLALDKHGTLYWTCKSAGVILQRTTRGDVSLFLGDLTQPSGLAVDLWDNVYFTMLPTPMIGGMSGGSNTVNVTDGEVIHTLTVGEPEPTDIAVDRNGNAYWTCKSAGVILRRSAAGVVSRLLNDLDKPIGIALDQQGRSLYFTEVPTPGVPASLGGMNRVSVLNLQTMELDLVDFGDPEPHDITVAANGRIYWTCASAGVIVEARQSGN
jgi:sugar lactone lactonase YvrE